MKRIILFLSLALCALFMCSGCSEEKATIDFEKCVDVTFKGYNGEGSAAITTDSGYILSLLGDMNTFSAAELLASFKIDPPANNGKLSNGDKVTVRATTNEEILKNAKVGVRNTELTFTVSGLEEKPSADIFAGVSLKVSGASPYCKVSAEYTGDLPLGVSSFSIVGADGQTAETYKDGDTVTIKLTENALSSLKNNYIVKETEREYAVKADSVYIITADDLTAERRNMLEEAVQKSLEEQLNNISENKNGTGSAIISKLTGYNAISVASSSAKITSIENITFNSAYIGTVIEKGSFGAEKEKHYIYYFYEADLTHNYKSVQTIHAVLLLRFSDTTANAEGITFSGIETGARKDMETAENDFITADFVKLS